MVHYTEGAISQGDLPGAVMALAHVNVLLKKELKDSDKLMKLIVKEDDDDGIMQKLRDKFRRTPVSTGPSESTQKREHGPQPEDQQPAQGASNDSQSTTGADAHTDESSDLFEIPGGLLTEDEEDGLSAAGGQ